MIDPILDAVREYEREVAPAYEVIRRARARLVAHVTEAAVDPVPALAAWSARADPTEPNGAEYAVEAIDSPEQGDGAPSDPAPASSGEAELARAAASPGTPPAGERSGRDGHGDPASATTPPAVSTCPECGKEFDRPRQLGPHRNKAHGFRRATLALVPPPAMEIHGGKERWLCGRCAAFFPTRSSRDKHQATHPATPVVAPVRGRHGPREVDAVLHPGSRP